MKNLSIVLWYLFRFTLINIIIAVTALFIAFLKNIIESQNIFILQFPFQLYMTVLFLVNLIYIIGNLFEAIHVKLWDRKIKAKEFEIQFFKVSLIMILIVYLIGVAMYFVNNF